jgi:hypothetical protein
MSRAVRIIAGGAVLGVAYYVWVNRENQEPEVMPVYAPAQPKQRDVDKLAYLELGVNLLSGLFGSSRNGNTTLSTSAKPGSATTTAKTTSSGGKPSRGGFNSSGGFLSGLFGGFKAGGKVSAGTDGASVSGYFSNGLPASIIGTESGGKLTAFNNEKGAGGHYGHGGRGQFGTARLKDAYRAGALDRPMTAAEFANEPLSVQQRVEQWHVQDIGNYIERNNLDQYIGQTVNGVEVTPNGMIAAAHLGGSGGLKSWLKSGRNPSDAYGTSLTDYMRTHRGYG